MENFFGVHKRIVHLIFLGIIPAAIYLVIFLFVTYPLILDFSTHFYADDNDGLAMIWSVWWTNKAITQLHQSPWHSSYIFYPYGVNLYTHTLTPFNGFLSILLLSFMSMTQAYNTLIVFAFVAAALTAFWLAYYFTKSYGPSVAAGFIFSFCNYHFAHAPGHLNLVSMQWVPLFVLCAFIMMDKPSVRMALASALCLLAVILCDYYYFFYCILITIFIFLRQAIIRRNALFFLRKNYLAPVITFFFAVLASSGVIVYQLWKTSISESFVGVHEAWRFSTDLLSPFVYGSFLRFSHLTETFWMRLPGNTAESSVYMGLSVIMIVIYVWTRRSKLKVKGFYFWLFLLAFFFINSLGPNLMILGKFVPYLPMPYRLLERIFPPLQFSGCPSRMMVVVMLSAAVICAAGLDLLFRTSRRTRLIAGFLLIALFVEYLPASLRSFRAQVPEYVILLRDLPDDGGVLDLVNTNAAAAYYSTIYNKPVWTGKIARVPKSLSDKKHQIFLAAQSGEIERLHQEFGFRYAILKDNAVLDLRDNKKWQTDEVFIPLEKSN
jgi:hypothetical protein